eukprot:6190915-Pleurochrysis_carterae.AAC.1
MTVRAGTRSARLASSTHTSTQCGCWASQPASLTKMRDGAIVGEEVCATPRTCEKAIIKLGYPVEVRHVTKAFAHGPPMLLLLNCRVGVYVIILDVITADEWRFNHAVAYDAAEGLLVDNHSSSKPVRIDDRDRGHKNDAKAAFLKLLGQQTALRSLPFT